MTEENERIYPCADCGKMRSKAEGGTTFTVCDECWDKHYKKPVQSEPGEQLREQQIIAILEVWQDTGTDYVVSHSFAGVAKELQALIQPMIEKARAEERERILEKIWAYQNGSIPDATYVIYLTLEEWQALSKEKE